MFYRRKLIEPAEAELREKILTLLIGLGLDQDTIAENLARRGIYCKRREGKYCPILRYLVRNGVNVRQRELGCGNKAIGFWIDGKEYWFALKYCPILTAHHDFIMAMDRGMYPRLELEGWESNEQSKHSR